MEKFIINTRKWLRGPKYVSMYNPDKHSMLFRPKDGMMCCLGQYALHLGATKDDIKNMMVPFDVPNINWPEWLEEPSDSQKFTLINDAKWYRKTIDYEFLVLGSDQYLERSIKHSIKGGKNNGWSVLKESKRRKLLSNEFAKHNIKVIYK